jgi:hypothetical protein
MYAIYYFAGGIPRLVNTLCDFALLYGFSTNKEFIEVADIVEVVRGRRIGVVNKYSEKTDEMNKAREFVRLSTGLDIAEPL